MNWHARWQAMTLFAKYIPWIDQPEWDHEDARALHEFMQTESGQKLSAYLRNFVLRQQSTAVSSDSNLQLKFGLCNGSKAILATLDTLAEPENFTTEEGFG